MLLAPRRRGPIIAPDADGVKLPDTPALNVRRQADHARARPQDRTARMITGSWTSQMIHVAARLSLADELADGQQKSENRQAARLRVRTLRMISGVMDNVCWIF